MAKEFDDLTNFKVNESPGRLCQIEIVIKNKRMFYFDTKRSKIHDRLQSFGEKGRIKNKNWHYLVNFGLIYRQPVYNYNEGQRYYKLSKSNEQSCTSFVQRCDICTGNSC